MSTVILLVVFLGAQSPAASPCTAPEYRQFDFWVGDWIVHNPKGQQVGANRIEAIENGCGILEQWTNARGTTGRSINIYRPSTGTWVQAWAGSDGLTLVLEGRFDRGKMVLQGESRAPTGARVRDRVTWSVLDGGKVHQFWEQSADGGKTWTVAFDGTYVRRSP
jgi:hypothetical protein